MDLSINETRQQIWHSEQYLADPEAHHDLFDECFKPDLQYVVKTQCLFNLVPKPSFTKKYIKITNTTMKTLLRNLGLSSYIHGEATLTGLLDITKIRKRMNMIFAGYVMTDGFATSVPLEKPLGNSDDLPELTTEDFQPWELRYMNIWGADPGVSRVYVASNGSSDDVYEGESDTENEAHEVRTMSAAEYYTKAGFKMTTKRINSAKTTAIHAFKASSSLTIKDDSKWTQSSPTY
ncbi:hypothetical protein DFQ28_007765 [Apophysomyces sp. BC1034]|nr:hypothetical protein DFQ29_007006 [Apophysomyces sp. BC1021]KAG0186434.1 hypothetical protein DFQ28_007765 [Apophysomyces sp. BC1034]